MNPSPLIGTPTAKAALQALGKRILENSTLYHFGKSDVLPPMAGTVSLPPKKQKLDTTTKIKEEPSQRDPYLSYEQYENLLYRGKLPHPPESTTHPQLSQQLTKAELGDLSESTMGTIDSLISDLPYDDTTTTPSLTSIASLVSPLPSLSQPLASPLSSSLGSSLNSSLGSIDASLPQLASPLSQPLSPLTGSSLSPTASPISPHGQLSLIPTSSLPATPVPNAAHAVALLNNAESQKIQRKKANQQEREVLEKYYSDHYVDQAVKIRKEDLSELSFSLNWHVLRVQGTKRRATLPQEQDLLKHYFKVWTEQGLIDLHSPTRVTPKDYEVVATTLGWDNERVRRWTDHYKQKIKAATEGNA